MNSLTVGIIGAGAWGTALGTALARGGHSVEIWALEEDVVESINTLHENKRYLPGYVLDKKMTSSLDIKKVASGKDFLILASPSLYLASTISKFSDVSDIQSGKTVIASLTKGFVPSDNMPHLVLETMENVLPSCYKDSTVYVAGPSHAEEVALGKITGLIAASNNHRNAVKVRDLLRVPGIMAYASFDTIGVQICAAVKNVIATVYGSLDAMAENSDIFGDNTESLLMAAGLNEIQIIGFAMGATHAETFTSISGVGDLDVTCKSKYGRNRRFGQDIIKNGILEQFKNLDDLILNVKKVGYLPEGAIACKYVHQIAEKKHLKLPICDALYRVLNKEIKPEDVLQEILSSR
ncbi:MAG: NAD(P)H-dependent glycerol-3-phosphate dehydrogenase [Treponema sp.]|nr:NAD(P)-dependent glycerol-3-phosphate dehydrogenase [Spirochaetales bacterium]MDY4902093.1 NAD(P)H-dependent glycerol-3-phosphate dehydrogenase [Treponema sp.]